MARHARAPRSVLHVRVGAAIRAQRERRGWTIEEFAARAGYSYRHVGEIERGETNATLEALNILGMTLGWKLQLDRDTEHDIVARTKAVLKASQDQIAESLEWLDAFTASPFS